MKAVACLQLGRVVRDVSKQWLEDCVMKMKGTVHVDVLLRIWHSVLKMHVVNVRQRDVVTTRRTRTVTMMMRMVGWPWRRVAVRTDEVFESNAGAIDTEVDGGDGDGGGGRCASCRKGNRERERERKREKERKRERGRDREVQR